MKPVVDGLTKEYKGKVDVVRVNVDAPTAAQRQLEKDFGVSAIPTFLFLNADGTVANKVIGETKEAAMRTQLDSLK